VSDHQTARHGHRRCAISLALSAFHPEQGNRLLIRSATQRCALSLTDSPLPMTTYTLLSGRKIAGRVSIRTNGWAGA